jgi:hypothetical protein
MLLAVSRRAPSCGLRHKDDPDPLFSALSYAQRRQLVDALGLDAAALQRPTWPTTVVSRPLGPGRDAVQE